MTMSFQEEASTFRNILHANVEHRIVKSASHQEFQREICGLSTTARHIWIRPAHTVDTLLISIGMPLLRLVPLNDQTITERKSCTSKSGAVESSAISFQLSSTKIMTRAYNSSQLNRDLARVVSMCLTASASNSSLVLNPFADCCTLPSAHPALASG